MIRRRAFLLTFYLIVVSSFASVRISQAQASKPDIKISVKDLQADALQLKKLLKAFHPAPYWYTNEIRCFDESKLLHDSLSYHEALIELSYIANSIRCGHTAIHPPKEIQKYYSKEKRLYPKYRFHEDGGKVKIGRAYDAEQCIPIGAELIKINNRLADSLYNFFFKISTTDGYNASKKKLRAEKSFGGYYRYYVEDVDSHYYEYSFDDSTYFIEESALALTTQERIGALKTDNIYWTNLSILSDEDHNLMLADSLEKTAILQINSFSNSGPTFYKNAFKYIGENNISNLILDLRNCPGGKVADSFVLLSYLLDEPVEMNFISKRIDLSDLYYTYESSFSYKLTNFVLGVLGKKVLNDQQRKYIVKLQPRKKNYKGNINVLINEQSFSASCIVASQISNQENCTILGLESGGGFRQSSAMVIPTFTLPNTAFRIQIPLYQIIHDTNSGIHGHGIFPDHRFPRAFDDKLDHTDLEYEYLLELANSEIKNAN